ncbi:hypothetical protein C0J52_06451 [Blattella germanica]|nr:hypothetical protein C0J52_06451 [Blattella germanica]
MVIKSIVWVFWPWSSGVFPIYFGYCSGSHPQWHILPEQSVLCCDWFAAVPLMDIVASTVLAPQWEATRINQGTESVNPRYVVRL